MSSNVTETPVVNNIEIPTKAEETPRQKQADTTPKDATSQVATPRVEAEKTAAAENQTAQSTKQEEKKVLGLAELTTLTNRVDEILLRSSSATLVSQRNLSSSLDVSYLSGHQHKTVTVETAKTSANPLYTSHIHTVASPTYSLPSYRSDVDLLRSIQNYQVKTVHGVESITRSAPVQYHHVEEVRSATYPSYSNNQYQVGYDRQKLDQIIARIQGTTPRTHTHTLEVVKNHSAPVDYRFHQASETKKSSRPQKESFKYIEADEDSFIQEAKSAQTQKYEEQVEVESPTKKRSINKRQEILSAKKQNPSTREVNSPSPNKTAPAEERQKGQSPYVAEQDKNEEKNDLIMLSKKPTLRNSYYFGNEQRRGGSTLLQDGRHRECRVSSDI